MNKDIILADIYDISDIIENELTEIKDKSDSVVRKYFKPVDNSKPIQEISELATDMLGKTKLYLEEVTAGAVEGKRVDIQEQKDQQSQK